MSEKIINKDIIEKIYYAQEKELDKKITQVNQKIKDKIKDIDTRNIEESENSREIKEMLEKIEENYSIKIANYIKEYYKQGFVDGVNLMINCLRSN